MDRLLSPRIVAIVSIFWNIVMTFVAIAIDAPSQFGIVGTDPADEWVQSGTAISAPPFPLVLLAIGALLTTRGNRWAYGIGAFLLLATAALFTIGGLGELAGEPTSHTSRGELLFGGIVAIAFAAWIVVSAFFDVRRRRATHGEQALVSPPGSSST